MKTEVIIDVGHAGGTGARNGEWEEHAVCAGLAAELREWLAGHGVEAEVIDFPDESNAEDLRDTVAAANGRSGVRVGVSLHMDAGRESAHGGHVCYYSEAGKKLAVEVAAGLCRVLPGRAERVVRRTDLYVLRHTKPVWVLCECGFITNAGDLELVLRKPGAVVAAIGEGVVRFLSK